MAHMNVFSSDAFSLASLTAAVEKVPHLPSLLGDMGLFTPMPVRTDVVSMEERDGVIGLVATTPRGAPLPQRSTEKRKLRDARTVRIAKGDRITAAEVQNIRAFGQESEFVQVQAEVMRRLVGPAGIMRDIELTWEYMRLGAVQGILTDADGSTLYNWFDFWGVTQPDEIDFDLDDASPESGEVRKSCATVVRAMQRAAKGAWLPSTRAVGIAGDGFWDDLIAHPEVRETYLNQQEAASLRGTTAWERLSYGGIEFINYRGTDDNSTVAVGTDKCKFFPAGAPGVFQVAFAPGEDIEMANTLGREQYALVVPDRDRNFFVDVEMYSYPLFYCTRPLMLQRAKRT